MAKANEAAQRESSFGTCIQKHLKEKILVINSFSAKAQLLKHLSQPGVFTKEKIKEKLCF